MAKKQNEEDNSNGLSGIDAEWERLKHLIPGIVDDNAAIDRVERDIFKLVDGKSSCQDILDSHESVSKDGFVLVINRLEKDRIVRCVEPVERLREVRIEKHEAQKELEFTLLEKDSLLKKILRKRDEISDEKLKNRGVKKTVDVHKEKIRDINNNIEQLYNKRHEATEAINRLVSVKMDIVRRNSNASKAVNVIKEEVRYLVDEKLSAMRSIKDLEQKIEKSIKSKASVTPKINICRGVMREAFKTLRDVRVQAEHAVREAS
ncbi:MAG: hypothetical protein ACUZ8O_03810 [Candidatus Anammoxibacter sp.]